MPGDHQQHYSIYRKFVLYEHICNYKSGLWCSDIRPMWTFDSTRVMFCQRSVLFWHVCDIYSDFMNGSLDLCEIGGFLWSSYLLYNNAIFAVRSSFFIRVWGNSYFRVNLSYSPKARMPMILYEKTYRMQTPKSMVLYINVQTLWKLSVFLCTARCHFSPYISYIVKSASSQPNFMWSPRQMPFVFGEF